MSILRIVILTVNSLDENVKIFHCKIFKFIFFLYFDDVNKFDI